MDVTYCVDEFNDTVRFIKDDIRHYRYKNIWYHTDKLQNVTNTYIPDIVKTSNIKVYIPKRILFVLFCLKVLRSISRPAWNMMYRMPTLPNSSKLASFDRMLSP